MKTFDDVMERMCISVPARGCILYLYPFDRDVADNGGKVMTRDGRVVRRIRIVRDGGSEFVTGVLDGETLRWDIAGRFRGPYVSHANDLYIPERYFDPDWRERITMTNAEWALRYQRAHPYAVMTKRKEPEASTTHRALACGLEKAQVD